MDIKRTIPRITLERYVLGELPPREMERIDEILKHDSAVHREVEEIRTSTDAILSQYPSHRMAQEIALKVHTRNVNESLRQDTKRSTLWDMVSCRPALAAVVAVVLLVAVSPVIITSIRDARSVEVTRVKGLSPHLTLYRNTEEGSERLGNLDTVSRGDIIQIGYVSAGKQYGVIFSVDGRGVVTLHYPYSETGDTKLEGKKEILLENAYELDDAPQFEHFFFITADAPITVETVLDAGKKLAGSTEPAAVDRVLDLPRTLIQSSFVLRKERS